MVKLMEDGRRQIGEFLMAGDLLGFDALDTYRFRRRGGDRRGAAALSAAHGRRAGGEQSGAGAAAAEAAAVSLRVAHARLVLLGRKTASERIASFLLEMAERLPQARPGVLDLPMSRTDMADHLGLTIETVCRVLAHLRREGTLAIERGSVTIRDAAALRQMASEARH